jgi:hypothetical protein
MSTLYLLWRKMGEYSSNPLWLGVFDSREKAEAARQEYIANPSGCPTKPDPYADQAYYDVALDQDVQIRSYTITSEVKAEVFLVECVEPAMFGQGGSHICRIYASRRQAKREVGRLRKWEKAKCQGREGFGAIEDSYHYFEMKPNCLVFPGRNE